MHDLRVGLVQLRDAYDVMLSANPSPYDRYVMAKDLLDAQWQSEMEPLIRDMYWHPVINGVNDAPDDEFELRQWLSERYNRALVVALLALLLKKYTIQAANLGGQYALDMLEIQSIFKLTKYEYLKLIDERAVMLTTPGSEQSLVDTTIDDLVIEIPKAKKSDIDTMLALGTYIALRAPIRTVMIERYERPWGVSNAQNWTYQENGASYKMYDVQGVGCKKICADWHGLVFTVDQYPTLIPQHSGCDCGWAGIQYDGQIVGTPSVAVSVPGLAPWTRPADPWTGGI